MSLVNNSEKTQPRLYKRGNDNIDLDAYIKTADAEFGYWLANSRLKDKEKKLVQDAYSKMIQGINDGTFTYKIGGGYDNSIGISNAEEGFDANGLAAGFLGNILRMLEVYHPEETTTPSYKGAKTIGDRFLSLALGEAGNILYFIDQDLPVNGKRSNTNRIKITQDYLNDIASNWDKYFTDSTSDLKDQWFKDYEKYGKNIDINNNGILDKNEYLGLSKLLGINNIEDLFYIETELENPSVAPSTPVATTPETPSVTTTPITIYTNEREYLDKFHPRSSVTNYTERVLNSIGSYEQEGISKLNNILLSLPNELLAQIVITGMHYSPRGLELNKLRNIRDKFGILTAFDNNFIIKLALKVLHKNGKLYRFYPDSSLFYIPYNSKTLNLRNTGLVYDATSNIIVEMDKRDIPFLTNIWHNEFIKLLPSHKEGGVLVKKFETGSKMSGILRKDSNRNNMYFTGDFSGYDNWHAHNIVNPWLTNYQNADKVEWEDIIKRGLDSWNAAGGFDWYNATDEERKHGMLSAGTQTHQQYIIDNLSGLNTEIAKYMNNYNVPTNANTNDRFVDGTLKGTDTDFGILTGNRRPTIHIKTTGLDLTNWENFYKNLGYVGKYQYLDHWVPTKNVDTEGIVLFELPTSKQETPKEEEHSDAYKRVFGNHVDENQLPPINESLKTSIWEEISPELIGAGRLWASLNTNNRVYNTILPTLKPVLKDTYERYSPITGAYSTMLFKNKQGNDTRYQAHLPFTSDASLASARMLEGNRYANQLQTEGFIADDREIKRTLEEALKRVEDNMARRSDVANFNRASINQSNRERALLQATRLKSNWQSWDNFLQGIEYRQLDKLYENRRMRDQLRQNISASAASRWYDSVMDAANKELLAWVDAETKRTGETPDISTWSKYDQYLKRLKLASRMMTALLYRDLANMYNMSYTSPYTNEAYDNFIKWI